MNEYKQRYGLVIPALNEALTIEPVIKAAMKYGKVIVVDDGSSDGTGEVAEKAGAIVITHDRNTGYDGAIASGFKAAAEHGFDYVITLDADGQHNPEVIKLFIDELAKDKADLVLGYRPKPARFAEACFRWYAKIRYGINDILCGMKGYRTDFAIKYINIASSPTIGTGVAIAIVKNSGIFSQVPVEVHPRKDIPRIGRTFKANMVIFKAMAKEIIGL